MEKNKNWVVRVYDIHDSVIDFWHIHNRTENEAIKEAEADVQKLDSEYIVDWTLTND